MNVFPFSVIPTLVQLCFIKNNGQRRYKYLVLGRDISYFAKKTTLILPTETDSINMVEVLIDSIFLSFVDVFFNRQSMCTSCAHLLADLFLYSYEADFIEKKLAQSFNFTFRYIEGRLRTKLYDKKDDFNFAIVNFPSICSNIPSVPAYGVCISQLIRYSSLSGFPW